jgi:hypothetical protein
MNFQEAFLRGHDVTASVQAIRQDRSADTTAREIARLYMNRDKANTSRKEMDLEIIQDYCSR